MKAVGFCETKTEKDHSYLLMADGVFDKHKVDFAIEMLSGAPLPLKDEKKQPVAKTQCVGTGCLFWGDDTQEGLCSQCFKKKMCGVSTTTTTTETTAAISTPVKCVNKCGFYGAKQWDGMCSVCFARTGGTKRAAPAQPARLWRKKFRRAMVKLQCARAFMSAPRLRQKNKTRCWQCNKKVGITGIDCRCGFIFCGTHRYAAEHNCQFDHKGRHQEKLRKANQQIVAKKFDTID